MAHAQMCDTDLTLTLVMLLWCRIPRTSLSLVTRLHLSLSQVGPSHGPQWGRVKTMAHVTQTYGDAIAAQDY